MIPLDGLSCTKVCIEFLVERITRLSLISDSSGLQYVAISIVIISTLGDLELIPEH